MRTLQATSSYYRQQQRIAATTVAAANRLWRRMGDSFDLSWASIRPAMLDVVQVGRLAAATTSLDYTPKVLAETAQADDPVGQINPRAFILAAPDGREMGTLLDGVIYQAKTAVKGGSSSSRALAQAGTWLSGTLLTVMSDTGRGVVSADIAQRPSIAGYVRMLNPPSCDRCVILAGKFYRWNEGFLRHKRCDCRHIPASEDVGGDMRTDPYEYFHSLDAKAQETTFGRSEARAIREGADIYRVVNVKSRGHGTAKAAAKYGTPTRMTVDDIFRVAGSRTNAVRLMESNGYITGTQVRGGNIIGMAEGAGQFGKGGAARAATNATKAARETGTRDPLNRYTMTAAERRLYDANYRLEYARKTGMRPQSIGPNSADKFGRPTALAPNELQLLEQQLAAELARLKDAPGSVKSLAKLLGLAS